MSSAQDVCARNLKKSKLSDGVILRTWLISFFSSFSPPLQAPEIADHKPMCEILTEEVFLLGTGSRFECG